MINPSLQEIIGEAKGQYLAGLNCAEAAFWALAKHWEIDIPYSVATVLGGGVARGGGPCGALLGAMLAIGAKVGRKDPADEAAKAECYRLGQELTEVFTKVMGSSLCKDIIGFTLKEEGGKERYAAGGFKDGCCLNAVVAAISAASQILG
ncbi:MAG: C-GCAxxG-C-C family protein [Bacillota bacterium]